jgi:predicted AAA+ superfamily ATPase
MYQRKLLPTLLTWKSSSIRRPIILRGARQVGKTSLIREFGNTYDLYIELNFQKDKTLHTLFEKTINPQEILLSLEKRCGKKINTDNCLIFFDEIQDCPSAINSLKYFCEDYPTANIIGAGSLLGIYLSDNSFPVGKVDFLDLYPFSFCEYLSAANFHDFATMLQEFSWTEDTIKKIHEINLDHDFLLEHLKNYFIVGGMPKAVEAFLTNKSMEEVRQIQEGIIDSYKADFTKYSGPVDGLKILSVFDSIPHQLAKDNRKFQFNLIKSHGARSSIFLNAVNWLISAGICHKIPILNHVEIPLKAFEEENIFKLYCLDVGILGAMCDLPTDAFLFDDDLFKTFKGAFTENFFLQEFKANRRERLYCWQGKTSEVDFIFQNSMSISPIEVKSGKSGKLKSLNVFKEKYSPPYLTRASAMPLALSKTGDFRSVPLYLSGKV